MEAQLTAMLQTYLIENGIDERAARCITAAQILESAREQEAVLLESIPVEIEAAMPSPVEPAAPAPAVLESTTAVNVAPTASSIPIEAPPTKPPPSNPSAPTPRPPKRALDDCEPTLPAKRLKTTPPAPLSQIASLQPSEKALCHSPTQAYYDFLSHHLMYISFRFAAVCTMLMRQKRVGDALAIGRYAVDFFGGEIWQLAVRYFELHEVNHDSLKEAKFCLSDCLEHIRAFDGGEGRRLHRLMADCAMHLKRELNVLV